MNKQLAMAMLLAALSLAACHRRKGLDSKAATVSATPTAGLPMPADTSWLTRASGNANTYSEISMRGDIEANFTGDNVRAKYTMRLKRDSVLWMSINGFGIEAIRIKANPDSVRILNRIERTYQILSFKDFAASVHAPVNFTLFQSAVLGSLRGWDSLYLKPQNGPTDTVFVNTRKGLSYRIAIIPDYLRLRTAQVKGLLKEGVAEMHPFSARIFYSAYKQQDGIQYPGRINLVLQTDSAQTEKQAIMTVDDLRVEKTQQYPFNVPARYMRNKRNQER